MADEVTTTSVDNIINSEWIQPAFQAYAAPWLVATKFLKEYDLQGKGSATVAVPSIVSQLGDPSDGGSSVDTEFNAAEATDLSNTAMTLTEATISTSEYGVMRELTDAAVEDTVDGFDLISEIANDNARILATALEDDVVALFTSFTNTVGANLVDMTLANLDSAIIGIRTRGVRAPDGLVAVLDDEQADNFEVAVTASNSAQAIYDNTADRFMDIQRDLNNGLTDGRFARYKSTNLYMTGLCDTGNTGDDVVGGVFVPDTPGNTRMAAMGIAWSRRFRVRAQRDEKSRSVELVATQRAGVSILLNVAGTAVITDGPS
jgi:hypothetical protein